MHTGFDRLKRSGLKSNGQQLANAVRAFGRWRPYDELERPVLKALGDDLLAASFRLVGVRLLKLRVRALAVASPV